MKRTLSVLLCLVFIIGLLPTIAFAEAFTVNVVQIFGIDAPVDGGEIDRFAEVKGDQPYTIASQPKWYDETDEKELSQGDLFEADHVYTVTVRLEVNDGNEFAYEAQTSKVIAHVNGKTAVASKVPDYQAWYTIDVSYTFPVVEEFKSIGAVTVDLPTPKPGEKASFDANLTGEGVRMMEKIPDLSSVYQDSIRGVEWHDKTTNHSLVEGDTFVVGHEYILSVFLEPEPGYRFVLGDENYSITVNGRVPNSVGDMYKGERRGYWILITCQGEVGEFSFNAVEPEVGVAPYFDVIPISPNVERDTSNITYYDMSTREHLKSDDVFVEGHYYSLSFNAKAKNGFVFAKIGDEDRPDLSQIMVNEHYITGASYRSDWSEQEITVACMYGPLGAGKNNLPIKYDDKEAVDGVLQYVKVYDVAEPKVGELPDQVAVTLSKNYRVPHLEANKIDLNWRNVTDGKDMNPEKDRFESGKEYEVTVGIAGYSTAAMKTDANGEALFKAYINGNEVDSISVIDENNSHLHYNFGVLGGKPQTDKPAEETPEKQPEEEPEVSEKPTETPSVNKVTFTDVPSSAYYYDPVMWAAENGITGGTGNGKFSPDNVCTRAQVVTFLWRAAGSPEPKSSTNPFTDVKSSDYFYKAVLWAVENNITGGTGNGKFSPDDNCIRAQVVTFLHRAAKSPAPKSSLNPFSDVAETEYYYNPVLWAVENNITGGTGNGKFSPSGACTRAQVVTFLYRYMGK